MDKVALLAQLVILKDLELWVLEQQANIERQLKELEKENVKKTNRTIT